MSDINIIIPSPGKFQLSFSYKNHKVTTPIYHYELFNNNIIIGFEHNTYLQFVAKKYFNYNKKYIHLFDKLIQINILDKLQQNHFYNDVNQFHPINSEMESFPESHNSDYNFYCNFDCDYDYDYDYDCNFYDFDTETELTCDLIKSDVVLNF